MKIDIRDWLLRMKTDSFLIIVNKNTNEYVNLYSDKLKNPKHINMIALMLDNHEKYE